jgi:hypothetical protein
MSRDESKRFARPLYNGEKPVECAATKVTPFTTATDHDRGKRAQPGTGVVVGSGAGAGGTNGGNEDYDDDDASGGGRPPAGSANAGGMKREEESSSVGAGDELHLPPGSKSL